MARPYRAGRTHALLMVTRWALARVRGPSMQPTLHDGDVLLLDRACPVRPGRLVVVRLPDGTVAVKRAVHRDADGWWIERDGSVGVDSWTLGAAVADDDVLGVARARLWPRARRFC